MQEYVERNLNFLTYSMMESNEKHSIGLEDFIKNKRQPTFNQTLFKLIDKKGTADTEIYKKAGLDRRHFSKIRSNPEYRPRKNTVVALALALELNKKETDKLLSSAGYSLSDSDTFDLVIQFCLEKKIYNVHDVNQALDYFSLKPFMGVLD
ncbi:hypothetical protein [Neobacillus sp. 114]|uniref:hypothetical protein n=1 Tax=Neobacillus sp. 114 TaxID=3048535 RepID=UPI0024C44497|nr:hypothetical protein [Neobacillus sp. 114]